MESIVAEFEPVDKIQNNVKENKSQEEVLLEDNLRTVVEKNIDINSQSLCEESVVKEEVFLRS